jgi:serine/threonine protein kinase
MRNLKNEIKVHWTLENCEGALQLHEIYEDEEYVYLVLDYQEGGSLMDYIQKNKRVAESETKVIIEQLLLTLDFMHKKNIIHRDIKLDNILITGSSGFIGSALTKYLSEENIRFI